MSPVVTLRVKINIYNEVKVKSEVWGKGKLDERNECKLRKFSSAEYSLFLVLRTSCNKSLATNGRTRESRLKKFFFPVILRVIQNDSCWRQFNFKLVIESQRKSFFTT